VRDTVGSSARRGLRKDGPLAKYYEDARTLAKLLTDGPAQFTNSSHRFVVCSVEGRGSWRRPTGAHRLTA